MPKNQEEPSSNKTSAHDNSLKHFPLSLQEKEDIKAVTDSYPVKIPKHYQELIDWNDANDPIRRQAMPLKEELLFAKGELKDPIGDLRFSPVERLTHRYPDRVLLHPTHSCALNCRFCFRKDSLSETQEKKYDAAALEAAYQYIENHTELREVILTGGDPLMLQDSHLQEIVTRLNAIPHLRALRIHSRLPAALPTRISAKLATLFKGRLKVTFVAHINHSREITAATERACELLRAQGHMLLSQSVLLKGVNDDSKVLAELFQELYYRLGIKPYYLHHCDMTRGLSHFRTSIDTGLELIKQLRGHLSGVCIPTYVLDLPEGYGKIPLDSTYIVKREGKVWTFRTYDGQIRTYTEVTAL